MKMEFDPPEQFKNNEKQSEKSAKKEERLRTFSCIFFKEKSLISAPGDKEIFVLDEKNKEEKELINQYGILSNLIWEGDPKINEDFFKTEDKLRSLARPLKKEDFLYIKDVTDKDLKLFYEIFKYNEIGFEIQTWGVGFDEMLLFLRYTKECSDEDLERILNFKKKFKIRPFLSILKGGREMGDKILTLAEKLPQETAEKVFLGYQKIIDTADNVQKILEEVLPEKVLIESPNEIIEIRDSLLIRAKNLLVNFYDKKENNPENLIKDLERYKSEILLYADTYKRLKDLGKDIKLEDIRNTNITILSQDEKEKVGRNLWDITKANRPFIEEGTDELKKRQEDFFSTIKNKDSNFYVLKHGGKEDIIAFCSFTIDKKGEIYAESLNVESEIKGSQIGGEFFPTVLEKIKKMGRDIYGHVNPKNAKILPYYERLGFKIEEIKEGEDLKYYEIRMPAQEIIKMAA